MNNIYKYIYINFLIIFKFEIIIIKKKWGAYAQNQYKSKIIN